MWVEREWLEGRREIGQADAAVSTLVGIQSQ